MKKNLIHVRNVHNLLQKKGRLETHIQNNHQPVNCKFCSISVKGLNELKKHEKQHQNNQDMVCEFCGLIVKGGKGELQKHVNQQHKKEKEKKILTRVEHSQTEDPPRSSEESDSDENTSEEIT